MDELDIEVFKIGTHTDSSGDTETWTDDDLNTIVDNYNNQPEEAKHEAPVVIGHPEDNSPAYGWVERLEKRGESLWAHLKDLTPQFVDWVKKGLYKKRSIALYENLLLRHIGFLGGVPPAVKGLADPEFSTGNKFFFIEEDFAAGDPTPTQTTVEQVQQEQKARADKYGIGVKDKIGYISKPIAYADLPDDSFADPTNYLYPMQNVPNILSSLRVFNCWDNNYTDTERQVIIARLLNAAMTNKIDVLSENFRFSELKGYIKTKKNLFLDLPIEELTKQQLTNYILRTTNNSNNNYGENSMDNLFKDLLDYLSATFGEEVANQTAAKIEELKTTYNITAEAPAEGGTPPAEGTQASDTQVPAEFKERLEKLEKENVRLTAIQRLTEFSDYVDGLIKEARLLPKQKEILVGALEMVHENKDIQFKEADNKIVKLDGVAIVKRLVESYPVLLEFEEQAHNGKRVQALTDVPEGKRVDDDSVKLHDQVIAFMEQELKGGKKLSYKEALLKFSKQ